MGAGQGVVPILVDLLAATSAWAAAVGAKRQGQTQATPQRELHGLRARETAASPGTAESPASACGPPCERSRAWDAGRQQHAIAIVQVS